MLNPVHLGPNEVRIDVVDSETYEDSIKERKETMKRYIVGIGWQDTYISRWGARPYLTGYLTMQRNRRTEIREQAERTGDEIIEWRLIHAFERQHVVQLFEVAALQPHQREE